MYRCVGNSAVQPHGMGGIMGGRRGTHTGTHTHTHSQERTCKCCTYPLATYPLKSARISKSTVARKRAEYGFGEHGFKTPSSVSFLALTELWGESSVSSSQPIICVPKRTHRVFFSQSSPSLPRNSMGAQ